MSVGSPYPPKLIPEFPLQSLASEIQKALVHGKWENAPKVQIKRQFIDWFVHP